VGDDGVDIVARDTWKVLAVERVTRGGEVQVVRCAAASDVDVCLGSSRGRIDPAGR
jgi:hypothetical protein